MCRAYAGSRRPSAGPGARAGVVRPAEDLVLTGEVRPRVAAVLTRRREAGGDGRALRRLVGGVDEDLEVIAAALGGEPVAKQPHRPGGRPLTPGLARDPVADVGPRSVEPLNADGADHAILAVGDREVEPVAVRGRCGRSAQPLVELGLAVRGRDAGPARDLRVLQVADDGVGVF